MQYNYQARIARTMFKKVHSSLTRTNHGHHVEQRAARWLKQQGLRLIDSNYLCRQGEIDLIMQEQDQLIFIEVLYRKSSAFGSAAETVNAGKQQKILLTAQHFLQQHPKWQNHSCRFDVIAAQPGTGSDTLDLSWIKNAFSA